MGGSERLRWFRLEEWLGRCTDLVYILKMFGMRERRDKLKVIGRLEFLYVKIEKGG